MSTSVATSRTRVAQSIRDLGVVKDARTVGRALTRIPMKTHAERVEFGWTTFRWSLHITTVLLVAAAVVNLVAGNLIETVGWATLAYFANRAAVHTFAIRQWIYFAPERRANMAAARRNVRRSRRMVRQSRRSSLTA